MAGIMHSASLKSVKGTCGHDVFVEIPPHKYSIGVIGKRNIFRRQGQPCWKCRQMKELEKLGG